MNRIAKIVSVVRLISQDKTWRNFFFFFFLILTPGTSCKIQQKYKLILSQSIHIMQRIKTNQQMQSKTNLKQAGEQH